MNQYSNSSIYEQLVCKFLIVKMHNVTSQFVSLFLFIQAPPSCKVVPLFSCH